MPDDNPHKLVARYRKARKIADVLAPMDIRTEVFAEADELARTFAARLAETNVPSEVTWALVVELIKERRTPCVKTTPPSTPATS